MSDTKMIGNKIAEARKRINISQAELAQRLFISSQAVGKWERGESMPDITTFDRLAEILGVDLNYFSENFQSNAPESDSIGKRSDEALVNQAPELTSKQRNNLSWDMSRGNWVDADFSGLKNLNEKFSSSNMLRCKFSGSDLSGLFLKANNVNSCDFSDSNLSNSHIHTSYLLNNIFKNCLMAEAEFSGTNIESCDLSNSNFTGTSFSKTFIYGCHLSGANLTGVVIKSGGFTGVVDKSGEVANNTIDAVLNHTSFIDTHIADLVFVGTLEDCYFENCNFTRVSFRNATLVNTFFKNNKNLKKIRFKDCKADRMTYEFLKQGKADLTGIILVTQ